MRDWGKEKRTKPIVINTHTHTSELSLFYCVDTRIDIDNAISLGSSRASPPPGLVENVFNHVIVIGVCVRCRRCFADDRLKNVEKTFLFSPSTETENRVRVPGSRHVISSCHRAVWSTSINVQGRPPRTACSFPTVPTTTARDIFRSRRQNFFVH